MAARVNLREIAGDLHAEKSPFHTIRIGAAIFFRGEICT